MKQVVQLDEDSYFVGFTTADESPLEAGVFLLPAGTIDAEAPTVPEGKRAKWNGSWVFEDIEQKPELTYAQKRLMEYPPLTDYLDGVVKGDKAQMEKYIAACKAVKAKYPKPSDQQQQHHAHD